MVTYKERANEKLLTAAFRSNFAVSFTLNFCIEKVFSSVATTVEIGFTSLRVRVERPFWNSGVTMITAIFDSWLPAHGIDSSRDSNCRLGLVHLRNKGSKMPELTFHFQNDRSKRLTK